MRKSPFKFLDSYTKEDREIFFGRDKEIEELHSRVFESKILLVYGTSGTGKSSLINCGLANRFNDADWLPVSARRGKDINLSIAEALSKAALTRAPFDKALKPGNTIFNLDKLLRSVYLDHFKPIFLILDQFEELFIFGNKEEKDGLIKSVAKIIDSDIQCRFIFSIREEYLAGVTEFEKVIPSFLSNRMRIEKMTRQNAITTIEGPCRKNNIEIESGFAGALLQKLNPDTPEVELTWLQIYLDKIMKLAENEDHSVNKISIGLLEKAGDVKDILGTFLEEQISQLSDPDAGMIILKAFVSTKGTKHQITEEQVIEYTNTFGKEISIETVKELIQKFIKLRILRDKDEDGRYELRHDSLASKIYEQITIVEKELLEVKSFIENAWSNYTKRGLLLTAEDLKYIAPYEDKLFLNEKSLRFIGESRQKLQRARRRRLNIAIVAVSVIIVILSLFSVWAMRSRKNAIILRQMALEQKDAAVRSKVEADSAKQVAVLSQLQAEESTKQAVEARNQSEAARKEALFARENALKQKAIAERMSALANEQAEKAEDEKKIAEHQREIALAAEKEAKRLSLLATAQNLALTSLTYTGMSEVSGLYAIRAFYYHINNGGSPDDPVIYKALEKAYSALDSSIHSVIRGSANEIRTLALRKESIIGSDIEGNLFRLDASGSLTRIANPLTSSFTSFVRLSPDGGKLLSGYENGSLYLSDPEGNNKPVQMIKHSGITRSACWSSDGSTLATGGSDSLIIIWESTDPVKEFKAHSGIRDLTFCGKDTIASVHTDGSIYVWDIKNGSVRDLTRYVDDKALCLTYDKLRGNLIAGTTTGKVLHFSLLHSQTYMVSFPAHTTGIDNIVFNNDFSLFATSAWDKTIHINNYNEIFPMHEFVKGVKSIDNLDTRARTLLFTNDNRLVAGMADCTIRLWEISSYKLADLICGIIKRNKTTEEWNNLVGTDISYEETCGKHP